MAPTINQLLQHPRIRKKKKNRRKALEHCPQKKGMCTKIRIVTPRKPNSAKRKVARIKIQSSGKMITGYIPGEGSILSMFNVVLVRGGRTPDLPGLQYKIIRGVYDAKPIIRSRSRSKYGYKRPKPTQS